MADTDVFFQVLGGKPICVLTQAAVQRAELCAKDNCDLAKIAKLIGGAAQRCSSFSAAVGGVPAGELVVGGGVAGGAERRAVDDDDGGDSAAAPRKIARRRREERRRRLQQGGKNEVINTE